MAQKLGLIAGNGRFPFLVLDAARAMGHDVVVIAIKEEASKEIEEAAARSPRADLHWVSIGQLGTFLQILKDNHITQAVMAGQVKHIKIFGGFVPDLTAMSLMMGTQFLFFGMLGELCSRIYFAAQNQTNYTIRRTLNFDQQAIPLPQSRRAA